jgi:phosphonate transport system substrate-binding protein
MTLAVRPVRLALLAVSGVALLLASVAADRPARAQAQKIRFGVGPLQPTPSETKKAFEPFFAHLAKQLNREYDLVATTDWAGISVALANEQVDLAWMGPWGYVLANNDSGVTAIATAKYDGKPIYYAIVVCKPGSGVKAWPQDAKGKRVSFADVGSTSGWLIPTAWFRTKGIDPKSFFQYSDGATHAANEIAVASGQADCATDFGRNRNAMIESGKLERSATEVVWQSDPLPNDAIAVRRGFDPAQAKRIQEILLAITDADAKPMLPNHYTGFVSATHASYKMIEDAGIQVGRIKKK